MKKTETNKKPQDFESVARELECDEDKARFEKNLRHIAKAPPTTKKKPT